MRNTFGTQGTLTVGDKSHTIFRIAGLAVERLPFSLRILLENLLRHEDGRVVKREHIDALLAWDPKKAPDQEINFHPARVLLQDFTGVPAVVDLAAMREALAALGGDAQRINPLSPVDLVIDHSVQVDHFGTGGAFQSNVDLEYERNQERYVFLRWGQSAFRNFRAVPPGTGICHQVNLEYLASCVFSSEKGLAYPDTLVGTDSHTTMINGLGVLGWGVGGIEAEASMLGQPVTMLIPEVVGFRIHGKPRDGVTATDVVLTVTQMLRKKGVVGKFVEFFGKGLSALSLPDRATIANMAPEYGATMGFFPVDHETVAYLRFTGRKDAADLTEAYCKEQSLYRTDETKDPEYSDILELDLSSVEPCLAGPKRPQDRVVLSTAQRTFRRSLVGMLEAKLPAANKALTEAWMDGKDAVRDELGVLASKQVVSDNGNSITLGHGAVVIAAITSCTNTSNPAVLVAAGLVAKKANALGLTRKPWVKTSLAPGSKVVTDYLAEAGLTPHLDALGFNLVGYGCTTCIGNSGPLPDAIADGIKKGDLVVASVLSGNRNFEGRVNPHVRMNFLASPPLVVAYAIAGTMDLDLTNDAIGTDKNGNAVFLKDIWPSTAEVAEALRGAVKSEQFAKEYGAVFEGDAAWRALEVPKGETYAWDDASTYARKPPFFDGLTMTPSAPTNIQGARCLALLGDSVTTDHISPAGNIAKGSPAAKYLEEKGVSAKDYNSYGARRGNHEVMMRGTFANIRLKNALVPGVEGGVTTLLPDGTQTSIYDAAMTYKSRGESLVVIAGAEYGTGSSRDWAAKGTLLLGVRAVIAKSFERIHRSNLVGMGVLPLELDAGQDAQSLGLTGHERFDIDGIAEGLSPKKRLTVRATKEDGSVTSFQVTTRIDTPNEVDYYVHGGILPYVLRQLAGAEKAS